MVSKHDADWIKKQDAEMDKGTLMIRRASDEALEYVADAVENIGDIAWRKMVVETQAVEMGIGMGIAEHLIPVIYKDMEKTMHKRLKIPKDTAKALRQIYIGRVIKNIIKELENGR